MLDVAIGQSRGLEKNEWDQCFYSLWKRNIGSIKRLLNQNLLHIFIWSRERRKANVYEASQKKDKYTENQWEIQFLLNTLKLEV